MQQLNFVRIGSDFTSDSFQAESGTVVVRVEMKTPGAIVLERSITGEKFIPDGIISQTDSRSKIIEKNVIGCVPGQYLRLGFIDCEPEKIYVLQ